ncbi:MAG TPA: hypothetical protein VIY47_04905, partial [Ignavibacteriaceae bacterium]
DMHDDAKAAIINDMNSLPPNHMNSNQYAQKNVFNDKDNNIYPVAPDIGFLPPSLITTTPNNESSINFNGYGGNTGGQVNNFGLADRNISNGLENPLIDLQAILQRRRMSENLLPSSNAPITPQEVRLHRGEMFNALPEHLRNHSETPSFPSIPQQLTAPLPPVYNSTIFHPASVPVFRPQQITPQSFISQQLPPPPPPPQPSVEVNMQRMQQNDANLNQSPDMGRDLTMNPAISSTGFELINPQPTQIEQLNNNENLVNDNIIQNMPERRRGRPRAERNDRVRIANNRRVAINAVGEDMSNALATIRSVEPVNDSVSSLEEASVAQRDSPLNAIPSNPSPNEVPITQPAQISRHVNVNVARSAEGRREKLRRNLERRRKRNREAELGNDRVGLMQPPVASSSTELSTIARPMLRSPMELSTRTEPTYSFPEMLSVYHPQHSFIPSTSRPITQSEGRRFAIGMQDEDMSTALARITSVEPMNNTVSSLNESTISAIPSEDELMMEPQPQRMTRAVEFQPMQQAESFQQQQMLEHDYAAPRPYVSQLMLEHDYAAPRPNVSQLMLEHDYAAPTQLSLPLENSNIGNALVPASQRFPVSQWSNLQQALINPTPTNVTLAQEIQLPHQPISTLSYPQQQVRVTRPPQLALPPPISQEEQIVQQPQLTLPAPTIHQSLPVVSTPKELTNTSQQALQFFGNDSPPVSPIVSVPPPPQAFQQPIPPDLNKVTDDERNVWRSFRGLYKRALPQEPTAVRLSRRKSLARKYTGVGDTEPTERHSHRSDDE